MRVCMLAYTFYEGDNRVMRYAESLAARGDEVEVIALRKPGQPREMLCEGVRVICVQERVKDERNAVHYLLRVLTFMLRASVVVSARHLRRPYAIVHVHSMPDFLVFAALLPKLAGAKLILDVHDLSPELYAAKFVGGNSSLAFRLLQVIERWSAAFVDHVIVANHLWQQKLLNRSVSEQRCSVFLNLPDSSIFNRRGAAGTPVATPILLYPGSLQWHQGLDVAICAFAQVIENGTDAEFHIYGDGQAKGSLTKLAEKLHLQQRVCFHQAQPLREIAKIMEAATIGIVPKRANSFGNEAFSTKILEFMATGVPVIAGDTAVDRYYFDDEVVTFFRSGCADHLALRIQELLSNPERRRRQADAAMQLVRETYSWETKKGEYLGLIDALAKEKGTTAAQGESREYRRVVE